ncbi:MAG: septum site-determining protein MinC [Dehalococcoidia bacterium]|nr:septum site-determining protein MinC [Dehalococcoidia bacterium]
MRNGGEVALKTSVVQVSGRGTNVDFTIDDTGPFDQVSQRLREYLVENQRLWSSGTISVNAGQRIHFRDQLSRIKEVIEAESGLTVGRFWCSPADLDGASAPSTAERPPEPASPKAVEASPASQPSVRLAGSAGSLKGVPGEALFIKETFRSGESIIYAGDVVVLADVNPGAEITADGDIVVFGCLRGLAHAGAGGDPKATVIALELDSPRIQIGPYIGLAPTTGQGPKTKGAGSRIAYVRRRSIYVSPFTGRFAKYSRGILYEG